MITFLEDLIDEKNSTVDIGLSPIKTPIITRETIDNNYKKSQKEFLTENCPICLKKFIGSIVDKHIIACKRKQLRPSATLESLSRNEEISKNLNYKISKPCLNDSKRSSSTQRLVEKDACLSCGAIFPKKAKFCMMCGNIRI